MTRHLVIVSAAMAVMLSAAAAAADEVPSAIVPGDWKFLGSNGDVTVFSKPATQLRQAYNFIWIRQEFKSPITVQAEEDAGAVRLFGPIFIQSYVALYENDCTSRRLRSLQVTYSTGQNGAGEHRVSSNQIPELAPGAGWLYAEPGSWNEQILTSACGR